MSKRSEQHPQGIIYALCAYISWGILPLYWKLLDDIPAVEILAHRILWSAIITLSLCLIMKKGHHVRHYFSNPKSLLRLTITGLLVSANWGVYIYTVISGHIVEASLGYFISPIFSIVLGMVFLGEKMNKTQLAAFLLAIAGVAYLTLHYGQFPWIAVTLALTFGLYGLLKKKMNYDSMSALAVETTLVTPIALGYLLFGVHDGGAFFHSANVSVPVLLILTGVITGLPLYWFGLAANRINLSAIGFFQYITPSMKLFIGVYLFHEVFSTTHAIAFSLIWIGLILYSSDMIIKHRRKNSRQS